MLLFCAQANRTNGKGHGLSLKGAAMAPAAASKATQVDGRWPKASAAVVPKSHLPVKPSVDKFQAKVPLRKPNVVALAPKTPPSSNPLSDEHSAHGPAGSLPGVGLKCAARASPAASKATQVDGPGASAAIVSESSLPAKPSVGNHQAEVPWRQPNGAAVAAKPPPSSIPSSDEHLAHVPAESLLDVGLKGAAMAPAAASKATQVDGPKASAATVPQSPLPAKPANGKSQAKVPLRMPNVMALAAKTPPSSNPLSNEHSAHGPAGSLAAVGLKGAAMAPAAASKATQVDGPEASAATMPQSLLPAAPSFDKPQAEQPLPLTAAVAARTPPSANLLSDEHSAQGPAGSLPAVGLKGAAMAPAVASKATQVDGPEASAATMPQSLLSAAPSFDKPQAEQPLRQPHTAAVAAKMPPSSNPLSDEHSAHGPAGSLPAVGLMCAARAPPAASKATQVDGPKASAATMPQTLLPAAPSFDKLQAEVPSRQPHTAAVAAKTCPSSDPLSDEHSAHGPTAVLPAAKAVMAYDDVWATPRSVREILAHVPEKGASWESSLYWHYHP